jgi:hypothetical protein
MFWWIIYAVIGLAIFVALAAIRFAYRQATRDYPRCLYCATRVGQPHRRGCGTRWG